MKYEINESTRRKVRGFLRELEQVERLNEQVQKRIEKMHPTLMKVRTKTSSLSNRLETFTGGDLGQLNMICGKDYHKLFKDVRRYLTLPTERANDE